MLRVCTNELIFLCKIDLSICQLHHRVTKINQLFEKSHQESLFVKCNK